MTLKTHFNCRIRNTRLPGSPSICGSPTAFKQLLTNVNKTETPLDALVNRTITNNNAAFKAAFKDDQLNMIQPSILLGSVNED